MIASNQPVPVVRLSGLYDAVFLLPLSIPIVAEFVIDWVVLLGERAMLGGGLDLGAEGVLFVNLMAILSVLFGLFRARFPYPIVGWFDVAARMLLGGCIALYLLAFDLAQILWLFVAVEAIWALVQVLALRKLVPVRSKGR